MARLADAQLADLVRRHFPQGQVTAYAIARAESGGDPTRVGDAGASIGLWQINLPFHPQYTRAALFNPDANAAAAASISVGGTRWTPWCTWEPPACGGAGNGRYRAYLAEAAAALGSPPPVGQPPAPAPSSGGAWLALAGVGLLLVLAARRPAPAAAAARW